MCDGILHVNMFIYFKTHIVHVHFFAKLCKINILDLICYCSSYYVCASDPPVMVCSVDDSTLSVDFIHLNLDGWSLDVGESGS